MSDQVGNQNAGFLTTRLICVAPRLRPSFYPRGTKYDGFSGHLFRIIEINLVCFVFAMSYLVHELDAIHDLLLSAISIWNSFLEYV